MENETLRVIAVIIISYLIGSIPTAYIIGKMRGVNIFEVGSGNMGATNVQRALGPAWGVLVLSLDALKGAVAILLAIQLLPENLPAAGTIAGIVAVVGHNWSLFASLITGTIRGGKGAAIAFGTMLMIVPAQVIIGIWVVGIGVVARTRYVSLAVLTMTAIACSWMLVLVLQNVVRVEYSIYSLVVAALIFYRHRENIRRLLAGSERRLGERA